MKLRAFLFASLAAFAVTGAVAERDASACGGCFVPPGPSTQDTAHRMAFAVSSRRTILWDQIQYHPCPGADDSGGSVFGCNAGATSSPLTWMGALFAGALVVSIGRRRR